MVPEGVTSEAEQPAAGGVEEKAAEEAVLEPGRPMVAGATVVELMAVVAKAVGKAETSSAHQPPPG